MGQYQRIGLHVRSLPEQRAYAIFDGARKVSGAKTHLASVERQLDDMKARAAMRIRPCLCCGTSFESEGIHNRLCASCGTGGRLGREWW